MDAREFVSSFDRPNIRYLITERDDERAQLRAFLREHAGESGIVYCLSRKKVDTAAEWLNAEMTRRCRITGMDQDAPPQSVALSARRGHRDGRHHRVWHGIDKPDVRFVAHLDLCRKRRRLLLQEISGHVLAAMATSPRR